MGSLSKPVIVSTCNKTCPEDCPSQFSSEFYRKHNPKDKIKVVMGCSAFPNTSGSISACMQHFNYKKHPNEYLLPKQCGKQKSGWKNSVSQLFGVDIKIMVEKIIYEIKIDSYNNFKDGKSHRATSRFKNKAVKKVIQPKDGVSVKVSIFKNEY